MSIFCNIFRLGKFSKLRILRKGACQKSSESRQKQGIDLQPFHIVKTMWSVLFQDGNRQLSQKFPEKVYSPQVIKWILYADDVALFCKSVNEAKQILNIINDTCNRFGLTISFKKTKTQVFNNAELAKEASLFSIQGNKIENVQTFTYLGHVISSNEVNCFTEKRIVAATNKFNEMRNVLTDTNVYMRTKRKILEACDRSRLTYVCHTSSPL